jgi:hypothetical protein
MTARPLRLKDLNLGFASADFEATHQPDLLLRGFIDHMGLVGEARDGRKFLFLGYKGSGKSALGEHLKLLAQGDSSLFVEFINIDDVSFATFSQILKGSIEPEARYPKVWSWLLLLFLINSFSKDEGSNFAQDDQLFLATEGLKQLGLLPEPSLGRAVDATSQKSFSIKLSTIIGSFETVIRKDSDVADFPFFIDRLKLIAKRFKSENQHLLIIDGFDELLRRGNLQYDALGALIFEANRLNLEFVGAATPAKIIVLCRTDLFERLPGPNKNKIRQNGAVQLEWYKDPSQPEKSSLIELINQRASLTVGREVDVFDTFLPQTLNTYPEGDIRIQLLAHTRHIPRDMVELFAKLREYSGEGRMTQGQVESALAAYSNDYMVPEVADEMDGYVSGEYIELTQRLLGTVRRVQPTLLELQQHAKALSYPVSFDLVKILNVLFECSAIGNIVRWPRGGTHVTFKYQNRHASFNQMQQITIHRGLWKGLNLSSPY